MSSGASGLKRARLLVSVALDTGVWAPLGTSWGRPVDVSGGRSFSSVALDGVLVTASRVTTRPCDPDGLPQLLVAAAPAGLEVQVGQVVLHDRDIDGSTLLAEIRLDGTALTWESVARLADGVVGWGDPIARTLLEHRMRGDFGALPGRDETHPPTALWAHTVIVCDRAVDDVAHACAAGEATDVLPSDFEVVEVPGARVFLGLHASLVCADDTEHGDRAVALLDELHAWWTATWSLDQALLSTATAMAGRLSAGHFADLGVSADLLAEVTTSTGILRTRLDSFRLGLGGFEWPIWDAACRRWALDENLEAVERKRVVLGEMTAAFRSALDTHQAGRLNRLAAMFAVVSALASFVAVVLFLFPTLQDPSGVALRVSLVMMGLAFSLAAILWSSRYMLRRARDRRATRTGVEQLRGRGPRQRAR